MTEQRTFWTFSQKKKTTNKKKQKYSRISMTEMRHSTHFISSLLVVYVTQSLTRCWRLCCLFQSFKTLNSNESLHVCFWENVSGVCSNKRDLHLSSNINILLSCFSNLVYRFAHCSRSTFVCLVFQIYWKCQTNESH